MREEKLFISKQSILVRVKHTRETQSHYGSTNQPRSRGYERVIRLGPVPIRVDKSLKFRSATRNNRANNGLITV